jgi:hypothetical protein
MGIASLPLVLLRASVIPVVAPKYPEDDLG